MHDYPHKNTTYFRNYLWQTGCPASSILGKSKNRRGGWLVLNFSRVDFSEFIFMILPTQKIKRKKKRDSVKQDPDFDTARFHGSFVTIFECSHYLTTTANLKPRWELFAHPVSLWTYLVPRLLFFFANFLHFEVNLADQNYPLRSRKVFSNEYKRREISDFLFKSYTRSTRIFWFPSISVHCSSHIFYLHFGLSCQ